MDAGTAMVLASGALEAAIKIKNNFFKRGARSDLTLEDLRTQVQQQGELIVELGEALKASTEALRVARRIAMAALALAAIALVTAIVAIAR